MKCNTLLFSKLRIKLEQSPALSNSSAPNLLPSPRYPWGKQFAQMHNRNRTEPECASDCIIYTVSTSGQREILSCPFSAQGSVWDKHHHWQRLHHIKRLCWQHRRAWELPYLVHQHYLMTCHWGCALPSSACNTLWKDVSLTLPGCKETPSVLPSPFPTAIETKKNFSLYTYIEQVKTREEKQDQMKRLTA